MRPAGGFTLVELLVVLLLLAVCASAVTVAIAPDARANVESEAQRLASLLELAALEARLTGDTITWASDGTRYGFERVAADGSRKSADAAQPLRSRELANGVSIAHVTVENVSAGALRLHFAPHLPQTAFTVDLAAGGTRARIARSLIGEIHVRSDAAR